MTDPFDDYRQSGLRPNRFDVVLARNSLHRTRDLDRALGQVRELLAPSGWLIVAEMCSDHYASMASLEVLQALAGLPIGSDDGRQARDELFWSAERPCCQHVRHTDISGGVDQLSNHDDAHGANDSGLRKSAAGAESQP